MKASPRDINSYLEKLDPSLRAVLIFGKDDGLIRERRDIIARQILPEPADPFCLCLLSPEQTREDPARIADEMGALSMTGGRRLVRLDNAGDNETEAIINALTMKTGNSLLLVTAGDLSPRSTLRILFEKETGILSIACYSDSAENLSSMITSYFRRYNIEAGREVVAYLTQQLGNDRLVTRAELEKISFYLNAREGDKGPPKTLTLEETQALTSDASTLTLGDIASATTGHNQTRLAGLLDKAAVEGINAVAILMAVQSRLLNLHLVRGLMDEGTPLSDAMKQVRPPIFFMEKDAFVSQVRSWPEKRLLSALDYAVRAEAACKKTGSPDFTIASKTCLDISRASGKRQ
ncbi:MAG: DNA polymerase III subunit delta [Proteobacteria bacterium]|nr:DNA polymerase III subunit delta [Pseudomonadota bacterium]